MDKVNGAFSGVRNLFQNKYASPPGEESKSSAEESFVSSGTCSESNTSESSKTLGTKLSKLVNQAVQYNNKLQEAEQQAIMNDIQSRTG
jgi:hypothetical protein